jgi:tRNA (guanine37-N1)-methyltransferase
MRFDILTLFPEMLAGPLDASILKRAQETGRVEIRVTNIRDFSTERQRIADDYSYGGGVGMLMKPGPIFAAVEAVRCPEGSGCRERTVLLTPQGARLDQERVRELAGADHLILICGHYEGVDERVREHLVTDEVSIGDYVLTGGELPALVVVDAAARLVPGVLGAESGAEEDSFASGLLEYPQYTRPAEFQGWRVPEVLLSGNHEAIRRWRREQALRRTLGRRPDLVAQASLDDEDRKILEAIRREGAPDRVPEAVGGHGDDEPAGA